MVTIPHNRPTLGPEEEAAALRVLRSKWLAQGREVLAFEEELADFLNLPAKHVVAVASGTAALYLALWALEAAGKSVAIPAYSCASLRHAVRLVGARETVVDSAADSPNADPEAILNSKAPIAIVPHIFGIPAESAKLKGVRLIEDCAQALGARLLGLPAGLTGEVGVYSFYATKLITSGGQGGLVATRNAALAEALRDYREFDMRRDDRTRFNFKMTDLQAAIGREQLKKLPSFLARREEIFQTYRSAGLDLLGGAGTATDDAPVRYRAVLRTSDPARLLKKLGQSGIQAIVPVEEFELLTRPQNAPRAANLCRSSISLPLYPSLTDAEVRKITAEVRG